MKTVWGCVGRLAYWITWPALYWYLRGSQRARVLVVADDHVLLVRPWLGSGTWILPGGGVRGKEDASVAACRELAEETGVVLTREQLQPLGVKVDRENHFRYTCRYFDAELEHTVPLRAQRFEILDARWVPLRDIQNYKQDESIVRALSARAALLQYS